MDLDTPATEQAAKDRLQGSSVPAIPKGRCVGILAAATCVRGLKGSAQDSPFGSFTEILRSVCTLHIPAGLSSEASRWRYLLFGSEVGLEEYQSSMFKNIRAAQYSAVI